jgi:hypothetical protein
MAGTMYLHTTWRTRRYAEVSLVEDVLKLFDPVSLNIVTRGSPVVIPSVNRPGMPEPYLCDQWHRASLLQHTIGRTSHGAPPPVEHVGIDHRGRDVPVPHEFMKGPYVVSVLQQVRCERASQSGTWCRLHDSGTRAVVARPSGPTGTEKGKPADCPERTS